MTKKINFPYFPECLNCRQGCTPYGYFYDCDSMDDTGGHSFVCRNCWDQIPKLKRWWRGWQKFTSQIAEIVRKDWEEEEEEW